MQEVEKPYPNLYAQVKVPTGGLPEDFKRVLNMVLEDARAKHLSPSTLRIKAVTFTRVLRWLSNRGVHEFSQVSPADMKLYIAQDNRSRNTVAMNCTVLRTLLRILGRSDLAEAVPMVTQKYEDDFEILTEENISSMLKATDCLQWQTRLLMLYEAGARPGEICNLRIRDVKVDGYGAQVTLRGKTGTRTRRLIQSVKLLENYLRLHPWRTEPDAPFFYADRRKGYRALRPSALLYMIQELAKRASIDKPVWTYLTRHSAATRDASLFTGWEMNKLNGWAKNSRTSDRYVHRLDERKLELKQLRLAGIQVPENELQSPLAPRICPRCNEQNAPLARYCSRCNMVLDAKLAKQIQAREDRVKDVLNVLFEDPEFRKMAVEKIREKGLE